MAEENMVPLIHNNITNTNNRTPSTTPPDQLTEFFFDKSWILPISICGGIFLLFCLFATALLLHTKRFSGSKNAKQHEEMAKAAHARRQPERVWYRRGAYTLKSNDHPFLSLANSNSNSFLSLPCDASSERLKNGSNRICRQNLQNSQSDTSAVFFQNLSFETFDKNSDTPSKNSIFTTSSMSTFRTQIETCSDG